MNEIQTLADQILSQHSFDFRTFIDAKATINSGGLYYSYDRMSLCTYEHNLSSAAQNELSRYLWSKFSLWTTEQKKARREYECLFAYFCIYPALMDWQVTKEVRPDFRLTHNKESIGVEITALTTEADEVLIRIAEQNFGKGKTAEKIYQDAVRDHGQKAKQYTYDTIEGHVCIGRNPYDINAQKERYADKVLEKYGKYSSKLSDFDKFIILCDARKTIAVTSEDDAKDVVQIALDRCPDMHGFTLSILYLTPDSACSFFEYIF